jgi:hypothetical protein
MVAGKPLAAVTREHPEANSYAQAILVYYY